MANSDVIRSPRVVNTATVKHRSPFRYPGGKTWLVPVIIKWLLAREVRPRTFIEPFAGGENVGLSVIFEDLAESLLLVERDEDVAATWRTILNGHGEELACRIAEFEMSESAVRGLLIASNKRLIDRAFATIVRNRVQRGGILAPGASLMKQGENGRGLKSRWYAKTLQQRIRDIIQRRDRIRFVQGDGISVMEMHAAESDAVYFLDPPYTVAGRRLYKYHELDHSRLFKTAAALAGDFVMSYDDSAEVRYLAERNGLEVREIPMKNTHHTVKNELLIGRDLRWLDSEPVD